MAKPWAEVAKSDGYRALSSAEREEARNEYWREVVAPRVPVAELMGELATVRYGIKSDGKIKVESKDEMKKRGLPSPDVVDAFVLTFAEVGRGRQKVRRTRQASWRVT